jgi:hypothetical protein
VQHFINDDAGYVTWLATHPDGFVLSAFGRSTPAHPMLHGATCHSISVLPTNKHAWTTNYTKACGERSELEEYARAHFGHEAKPCGQCLRTRPRAGGRKS